MKKAIILCFILLNLVSSTYSFADDSREYQIKAGFLYKFLFFTDWPEEASTDTMAICILGEDPFGDIFESIEGKQVNDRKLVIKRYKKGTTTGTLSKCHLLYISTSLKSSMTELLDSLKDHPVVTVSDVKEFCSSGGMINFFRKENRVVFEINKSAAERVGVKFRSKLLRVATSVIDG